MGADSDRAAEFSPDEQTSRGSFFSRFTLPLRSSARNLADFHVRPDDPHRQYSAGDHVTGSVILSTLKPLRITHLTVALQGYVRVYKNGGTASHLNAVNPATVSNDGSRSFRYYGNGHASLFSDEQVLCGEGRLTARRWEFKFDLIFPAKGLPSSIDFERGTISYIVTATLTRPTSIAPTISAERKVSLVERVDIGLISPPRERKVTMHAMHRRTRRKKQAVSTTAMRNAASAETPDPVSDVDSMRMNETTNDSSVNLSEHGQPGHDCVRVPRSPIQSDMQSEVSAESVVSMNSNSVRVGDASACSATGSRVSGAGKGDREITATVELLKGGCLPGDVLPLRIHVDHNRRIQSMHGIVVTLYRQGRVDYAPPTSLFTNLSKEDARRLEREEYYPKSRTGLGGLSLSSAGSCSVFRKDLSQAVSPLIIDPLTLSATINTSIRVPEDVFPSIKGVPGSLVSFKYHVEVIVDLGGKLAGQTQGSAQPPGRVGSVSTPGPGPAAAVSPYDGQLARLANWNGTIVDTDHLRREKGVISVSFEVVVGTMDSNRSRGKAVVRPTLTLQSPSAQDLPIDVDEMNYTWQGVDENGGYNENGDPTYYQDLQSYCPTATASQPSYYDFQPQESRAPVYVAPPRLPDHSGLSDKERMRQAEQRLLPSQPPSQPSDTEVGPSQPSEAAQSTAGLSNQPSQPSAPEIPPSPDESTGDGPSAPTLADLSHSASSNPEDDKQELERRRLIMEASAPPEVPEDYETGEHSAPPAGAATPSTTHEPSAPVLDENNAYGSHDPYERIAGPSASSTSHGPHGRYHGHGAEPLPKYER